jgi:hypothetical protein
MDESFDGVHEDWTGGDDLSLDFSSGSPSPRKKTGELSRDVFGAKENLPTE